MNLLSFIPDVYTDEDQFYKDIIKMKEFTELAQPERVNPEFYNHQEFIKRLFAAPSPQRSILIKHPLGFGKTLSALITAFALQNTSPYYRNPITIFVRNAIIANVFETEIKRLWPDLYKTKDKTVVEDGSKFSKSQMRQDFKIKEYGYSRGPFEYDLKIELIDELIKELNEPTMKTYTKIEEKFGISRDLPQDQIIEKLKEKRREFEIDSPKLKEQYSIMHSNSVIILDEAHNLRDADDKKISYSMMTNFLGLMKNKKVILLSATPIYDNKLELISIMNLILPDNKKLDAKDIAGLDEDDVEKYFKDRISGYVSYLDERQTTTKVKQIKSDIDISVTSADGSMSLDLYALDMKNYQRDKYLEERRRENLGTAGGSSFYTESKMSSSFVFPPLPPNLNQEDLSGKYLYNYFFEGIGARLKYDISDDNIIYNENGRYTMDTIIKTRLDLLSVKFDNLIKQIKQPKFNQVTVFYSFYLYSGIYPLASCLEKHGFERFTGEDPLQATTKKLRYTIVGHDMLKDNVKRSTYDNIFSILNHPKNKLGEYIMLVLISANASEGMNILTARQFIFGTVPWTYEELKQLLGRVLRGDVSLSMFPVEERFVNVYYMAAGVYEEINDEVKFESIDARIYQIQINKAVDNKKWDNYLRKFSIDRGINNSVGEVKLSETLDTNYLQYYLDINPIRKVVDKLLQTTNKFSVDDIIYLLEQEVKSFSKNSVIIGMTEIIENREMFLDRNGYQHFINEKQGIYYAHTIYNLQEKDNFDFIVQPSPYFMITESLKTVMINTNDNINVFINEINNKTEEQLVQFLVGEIDPIKMTNLLELYIDDKLTMTDNMRRLMNIYENFIFKFNGVIVHTLTSRKYDDNHSLNAFKYPNKEDGTFFRIKDGKWRNSTLEEYDIYKTKISNKGLLKEIYFMEHKDRFPYYGLVNVKNMFSLITNGGILYKKDVLVPTNIRDLNVEELIEKINLKGIHRGNRTSIKITELRNILASLGVDERLYLQLKKEKLFDLIRIEYEKIKVRIGDNEGNLISYR